MNALVLLHVRQLFERLVAEPAQVLADVSVHEKMLRELLRRGKRLEALAALVAFVLQPMNVLGMMLHFRLALKLLQVCSV